MTRTAKGPTAGEALGTRAAGEPQPEDGVDEEPGEALFPIGQVAVRLDMSERTLRYYEEIGLLTPVERTPGRIRRYSEADITRVARIRELRELMGFNLEEVGAVLANEDRLYALRQEYRSGEAAPARRARLLAECLELHEDLRARVVAKKRHLAEFLAELDARSARIRAAAGLPEPERTEPERTEPERTEPGRTEPGRTKPAGQAEPA
ncbi:MAG: MerR family transcriptional regulator [Acidimicrobiales bacterium]